MVLGIFVWQVEFIGVLVVVVECIGCEFVLNLLEIGGWFMIVMGVGVNYFYYVDEIYWIFLVLMNMCVIQGVNGGGWVYYVGQEKVCLFIGWVNYLFVLDWVCLVC